MMAGLQRGDRTENLCLGLGKKGREGDDEVDKSSGCAVTMARLASLISRVR